MDRREPYDHPAICARTFFPEPDDALCQTGNAGPALIPHPGGFDLSAWWSRDADSALTILYFHGNGESIRTDLRWWPSWSRALNVNVFLVDYPGYGRSGGVPTYTTCRQTGEACLDHLLARPASEVSGIVLMGRSLGSWVALTAAAARASSARVRGLVLESGVSDIGERLERRVDFEALGLDRVATVAAVRRDFDLAGCMTAVGCPVLVLHARHDSLVPVRHAERLADWAGSRLFRRVLFEEGDHNTILAVNQEEYRRHLTEFLAHVRP